MKSEETRKKMSESAKKRIKRDGHPQQGKPLSQQTKDKISKKLTGTKFPQETKDKIKVSVKNAQTSEVRKRKSESHIGILHTEQYKKYMSEMMKKRNAITGGNMLGKTQKPEAIEKMRNARVLSMKEGRHYKGKFRKDLGQYFRSKFEANYARFLKWFGMQYEFESEKCEFVLSNGSRYMCDFYLPEIEQFIETKGYDWKDKTKNKYVLFQKDYPDVKWRILWQTSFEWKDIIKQYSKLIPCWEK